MEKYNRAVISYKNHQLHINQMNVYDIGKQFETPLYIYCEEELRANYTEFKTMAEKCCLDVKVCFALKANANRELLSILASMGAGADIVSGGELKRAIESGIKADSIVFSGVGKTEKEIKFALEQNIYSFNVESLAELEVINQLAGEMGKTARVAFRVNPKVIAKTHKHISTGYKTHKFGLLPQDILESIREKKYWEHTKLVGLSVHIGSQLTDLTATAEAIKIVCECAQKIPHQLEFIDVGGGLGVLYEKVGQAVPTVREYMQLVADSLTGLPYPVKVVFEPGRRIVASAGYFLAKVIRTKLSEDCHFVIVDGGMNDFVRPSLYEAYHEIYSSVETEEKVITDVVGPICETADCFGQKRELSLLEKDDYILIADTGAYGYSMASNYNLREKPKEILLDLNGKLLNITQN